jgi:hypothetical protein
MTFRALYHADGSNNVYEFVHGYFPTFTRMIVKAWPDEDILVQWCRDQFGPYGVEQEQIVTDESKYVTGLIFKIDPDTRWYVMEYSFRFVGCLMAFRDPKDALLFKMRFSDYVKTIVEP